VLSDDNLAFIQDRAAKAGLTPEKYLNMVVDSHAVLLRNLAGRGLDCTPKEDDK